MSDRRVRNSIQREVYNTPQLLDAAGGYGGPDYGKRVLVPQDISRVGRNPRVWHTLTRRDFTLFVAGSLLGEGVVSPPLAMAAVPNWDFYNLPDTQFLAISPTSLSCDNGTAFATMMTWLMARRNGTPTGLPFQLNVKGVFHVGDCQDVGKLAQDTAANIVVAAYQIALNNGVPVIGPPGNHDYDWNGSLQRSRISWLFQASGPFGASALSARYPMTVGDTTYTWGGVYPEPSLVISGANHYVLMSTPRRRIAVFSLEFYPRPEVWQWVKDWHDAQPGREIWIFTHGWLHMNGSQATWASTWGPGQYSMQNTDAGTPNTYAIAPDVAFTNYIAHMPRVTLVKCGHWVDGYNPGGDSLAWVWNYRRDAVAGNPNGKCLQVFSNQQVADTRVGCSGGVPDGTTDMMHADIHHVDEANNTLSMYLVSANSGKWVGQRAQGYGLDNAVELFNVPFSPVAPSGLFPLPGVVSR